tara:strand:+ start:317 stop:673 length:357 start_codon:yes stop_codon:yes gene_type:complete
MTNTKLRLIDKAESHFKDVLGKGLEGPIKVEEWDAEVWYKPSTTLYEESRVIELTQAGKATEALVVTLINRARDKDGNPLFDMGDKLKLMRNVDPKIVLRIVTEFNKDTQEVDKLLGN